MISLAVYISPLLLRARWLESGKEAERLDLCVGQLKPLLHTPRVRCLLVMGASQLSLAGKSNLAPPLHPYLLPKPSPVLQGW